MVATASLEDAFIKVSFEEDKGGDSEGYASWVDRASAKFARPNIQAADLLRKLYPMHSLVMSQDYTLNLLGFPNAVAMPLKPDELITNAFFVQLGRGGGGVLINNVEFGAFKLAWETYEFTVYIIRYQEGLGVFTQHYILHEGPQEPAQKLLVSAGIWANELHDEVWVFNQGFWQKNADLWREVQKANWDDVILDESFKKTLQKDVYSFFGSESLYKSLGIPWKRGIIMRGPPGNGKTISLKAIMKTVQRKGHSPLYVKSFQSYKGEEGAMQDIFAKARLLAPCVMILEDLDSLINDRNRSFFLNQLDGIEGNDGLLLIGTTNHFDRLDPGLSARPSRFDRIFFFDNPSKDERVLYAQYWQKKLKGNKNVPFPDELVEDVASLTCGFSFAYLKECFVSSLVIMASDDNDASFEDVLKTQIKALRKQLEKDKPAADVLGLGWSKYSPSSLCNRAQTASGSSALLPKPDAVEMSRTSVEQTARSAGPSANSKLVTF